MMRRLRALLCRLGLHVTCPHTPRDVRLDLEMEVITARLRRARRVIQELDAPVATHQRPPVPAAPRPARQRRQR